MIKQILHIISSNGKMEKKDVEDYILLLVPMKAHLYIHTYFKQILQKSKVLEQHSYRWKN